MQFGMNAEVLLAVSADGTLLYAPPVEMDDGQLLAVARDGTSRVIDPAWRDRIQDVSLSPDGSRIAFTREAGQQQQVWIKELDAGPLSMLGVGGVSGSRPQWSADGKRVTFSGTMNESLLERTVGSSDPAHIVASSPRGIDEGLYSRDGRWVIVRLGLGGNRDIFAKRVGADTALRPIIATAAEELSPSLSPDGTLLAYVSDESGRREVYVSPFPDAQEDRRVVSRDGGLEPAWSPDGRELFFKSGGRLQVVTVTRERGGKIGMSAPRMLFSTIDYFGDANHTTYAVGHDAATFYMVKRPSYSGDRLVMVRGWFEELRRASRP